MTTESDQPKSFQEQFEEVRTGIEAAGNLDPYDNEVLRTAYLGASALIDASDLKPVEQISRRKEIAELAGELATKHSDETTAAEMADRVKDCDSILTLINPEEKKPKAGKAAKSKAPSAKKADTSAAKTSGTKGY